LELAGSGATGWLQSSKRPGPHNENRVGQDAHQIDDHPNRNAASTGNLAASFAAARQITVDALGESARTFSAQTDSGRYNGRIIGETTHHVVQRLSPRTAVAHMKHLLDYLPQAGDNVAIAYSNDHGLVQGIRERVKTHELVR
jgi:hypothetical protein